MPQHLLYPEEDNEGDNIDQEIELPMSGIPPPVFLNPEVESDEGDDSAPEDVTFTASKTTALERKNAEKSSAKKLRDAVKEKRKKRQEFFLAQSEKKKSRLDELAKRKLPDDFLKSIPEAKKATTEETEEVDPVVVVTSPKREMKRKTNPKDTRKPTKKAKNQLPTNVIETSEDFLPLNSKVTEFHVKVFKEDERTGNIVGNAKDLMSLKNKLITGASYRREPTERALSRKVKQAAAAIGGKKHFK